MKQSTKQAAIVAVSLSLILSACIIDEINVDEKLQLKEESAFGGVVSVTTDMTIGNQSALAGSSQAIAEMINNANTVI